MTIATLEYYRALITKAGLGFAPLRPGADPSDTALIERIMDRAHGSEFLLRDVLFPAIRESAEDISRALEGADVLVSHPVTFAAPVVAEQRRLPWASVVLAPASMFSVHDFPVLAPAPWVKSLDALGTWPARLLLNLARRGTHQWAEPLFRYRAELGLPEGGNPVIEGQHSPHLVLAMYSACLGAPQQDWPRNVVVTGHAFHDAPHGTGLSADLERFLGEGEAPVVFTLGSSVVRVAKDFWRESLDAVRRLGARAVLLAGPEADAVQGAVSADDTSRARVIVAGGAPHSLLFPRASAVVQQCGIGTLAQSLRSGRPMLGVPFAHDQPDNAARARSLGMSRTMYPSQYRGPRVARELSALLGDERYSTAAARVAAIVRAERGVEAACDALERTFHL